MISVVMGLVRATKNLTTTSRWYGSTNYWLGSLFSFRTRCSPCYPLLLSFFSPVSVLCCPWCSLPAWRCGATTAVAATPGASSGSATATRTGASTAEPDRGRSRPRSVSSRTKECHKRKKKTPLFLTSLILTQVSYYAEHDMEISFEVNVDNDDLMLINRVRFLLIESGRCGFRDQGAYLFFSPQIRYYINEALSRDLSRLTKGDGTPLSLETQRREATLKIENPRDLIKAQDNIRRSAGREKKKRTRRNQLPTKLAHSAGASMSCWTSPAATRIERSSCGSTTGWSGRNSGTRWRRSWRASTASFFT